MLKQHKKSLIVLMIIIIFISIILVYFVHSKTKILNKVDNLANIYAFARKDDRYIVALMNNGLEIPILDGGNEEFYILDYDNGRLYLYSVGVRDYKTISYIDLNEDKYKLRNVCKINSYDSDYLYVYNDYLYYKIAGSNDNIIAYNLNTSEEKILQANGGYMYLDKKTGYLYYSKDTIIYSINLKTFEKTSYDTTNANVNIRDVKGIWTYDDNIYFEVLDERPYEIFQYNKETKQSKLFDTSRTLRHMARNIYDNKMIGCNSTTIYTIDFDGNKTHIYKSNEYIDGYSLIYNVLVFYKTTGPTSSMAVGGIDLENNCKELNLDEIPSEYLHYTNIFHLN